MDLTHVIFQIPAVERIIHYLNEEDIINVCLSSNNWLTFCTSTTGKKFLQSKNFSESIIKASTEDDIRRVSFLIAVGISYHDTFLSLYKASEYGNDRVINILLDSYRPSVFMGGNIIYLPHPKKLLLNNINIDTGCTHLCIAVINKHYSVVELLLKQGAYPNLNILTDKSRPLFNAIAHNDSKLVSLLLEYKAFIYKDDVANSITSKNGTILKMLYEAFVKNPDIDKDGSISTMAFNDGKIIKLMYNSFINR